MSFLREGIDCVRVFALPDGVAADGRSAAVSRTALVTWRSVHTEKLYQVYAGGRFAGATLDVEQRSLVIQAPSSFQSAVRVEVVAVEPEQAHMDFAAQLGGPAPNGRVKLTLLRSQVLPIDARINIYTDNGAGQIDYTEPVNALPLVVWSCTQDKAGFGMARFGTGDFGYDSAAAIGFGKGSFGHGQFGLDADTLEWVSPELSLGRYRFGVKVIDAHGNESLASETEPMAVVPAATPAAGLDIVAFDPATNQLTLRISDPQ